jgi:hypothetical protein
LQHALDVALAMVRLMEGYERAQVGAARLGPSLFAMGIIAALFHDCGFLRSVDDTRHSNGGEWTLTRASRGATFLKSYLPRIGLGHVAEAVSTLVHFTGYEMPVAYIPVPSFRYRVLGSLLGSADIIAEMADRCYLEKCRDRLYPELLAAGLVRKSGPDGTVHVLFESGDDLVMQTPRFYVSAMSRLRNELGACYQLAARAFDGRNLYLQGMRRNACFAKRLKNKNDVSSLKRVAPCANRPSACGGISQKQ